MSSPKPSSGSTNQPTAAKSPLVRNQSISSSSSPSHNPSSKPLPARVRKTTLTSPRMSANVTDDLERERAKAENLKALVTAAEEREADALREASNWRSKVDELVGSIDRLESQLSEAYEAKSEVERLEKELERVKSISKENERKRFTDVDEFESTKATWLQEEAQLRSKLTSALSEKSELQKLLAQSAGSPIKESDLSPEPSPLVSTKNEGRSVTHVPDPVLVAALESANQEKTVALAQLEKLVANAEQLKNQLTDLERVNSQLMDDNESYQILVGEKTLMGGFDVKEFLRANDFDPQLSGAQLSSASSSTGPSLAEVEEEDEDEDEVEEGEEEEDEIERAVLESHGAGSRNMGAVEAGVMRSPKPKAKKRGNNSTGGGLDLAAELAQAEENEETSIRVKKAEERKNFRKELKEKDIEIKKLQDAQKALVLYISKILDRIQAHEGFEKVLSSEYGHSSPAKISGRSPPPPTSPNPAASITAMMTGGFLSSISKPAVETTIPLPHVAHWLQSLFGSKSSSNASGGIKPLKLGSGPSSGLGNTAGLSGGWSSVKEFPEIDHGGEEGSEETRRRERELAEMKLHGLTATKDSKDKNLDVDRTIRANRRSSSMYGPSTSLSSVLGGKDVKTDASDKERRRRSGDLIGKVGMPISPPALTPAEMMKRVEEREKESKSNLSKGQASGFTEIEIRGHRLRPFNNDSRSSNSETASPGSVSPILNDSGGDKNLSGASGQVSPGIKDLKMAGKSKIEGG
ncbi:hypothetical protein PPACK8108_LOCUS25842 [Phakopsora pachyrhizi]|uniref:Uncharacterized protein n=1 Tax=Phakopsora pachyrhizi TaxID=170000 RepID=A0AAV0BUP0_PHAPC|nr:hypothetical protein PPACK8108_LOCUS25842 [Phakopsora pachyrhizi]